MIKIIILKKIFQKNRNFYKKYSLSKDSIIVSYVGNIGYQSEFNTIIKAADLLEKQNINIIFVLGTGPLLNKIQSQASYLTNVRFTG